MSDAHAAYERARERWRDTADPNRVYLRQIAEAARILADLRERMEEMKFVVSDLSEKIHGIREVNHDDAA